jgi:RNA polymerase sigma factor (sigma-70 family)
MEPVPEFLMLAAIDSGEPARNRNVDVDVDVAGTFESLFADEQRAMLRLAVRLVDVPERAEEIVQDGFEKTLLAWHRLTEPGAYLRTAVVNGCRSELRRRAVMRRHAWPAAAVAPLDERDASLLQAVARLTPQRRIAITLRFYLDLPEAEIAALMRVRPGTVKSLVSRGLADLRQLVEES